MHWTALDEPANALTVALLSKMIDRAEQQQEINQTAVEKMG